MKAEFSKVMSKFRALSVRERALVLLALLAVLYQVADWVLIGGKFAELEKVQQQVAQQRQSLTQVALQVAEVATSLKQDPNRAIHERNERLAQRLESRKAQLQALTDSLMAPRQMARLLEQMLADHEGLHLLRLETQSPRLLGAGKKPQPTKAQKKDAAEEPALPVYVHAFAVEFEGDYFAILRYLEALESLPDNFYWDRIELQVREHPGNRIQLDLYTLSLSEDWIGV